MQSTRNAEELANSLTHGVGLALSVVGLGVLLGLAITRSDGWRIAGAAVFGLSLVLLYAASPLYHSVRSSRLKRICRIGDHTAIYLLIAGTYTPYALISLKGVWGWTLLIAIWTLCTVGVLLKMFCFDRFTRTSIVLYVVMGWLGLIAIKPLIDALSLPALVLLFTGGLLYTGGIVFFALKRIPFGHTIWHVFVMAGSTCHFFSVLLCVMRGA
jgi:hemolysin III